MKSLALAALVIFGGTAFQQEPVYKHGDPGIKNPTILFEKKPAYTAAAMRAKIQGSIEMEAVVDKEGKPVSIKVIKSLDKQYGLDEKAVTALQEWRFRPATKDGKPVPIRITVEMTFTLRDRK